MPNWGSATCPTQSLEQRHRLRTKFSHQRRGNLIGLPLTTQKKRSPDRRWDSAHPSPHVRNSALRTRCFAMVSAALCHLSSLHYFTGAA